MQPTKTYRETLTRLDKLRLLVAHAIIRNRVNRDSARKHIWQDPDAIELYEQYTLKILLNWLATRCGFPLYTNDITSSGQATLQVLDSWQEIKNRYPFYSLFDAETEEALSACGFQFLDDNLSPELEIAGMLYTRSLAAPLAINNEHHAYIEKSKGNRTNGEFYTPAKIVKYCFSLLSSAPFTSQLKMHPPVPKAESPTYRLIDPACGSGNFLIGAIKYIGALAKQSAQLPDESPFDPALLSFATHSLYGSDIDTRAVNLARVGVLLSVAEPLRALQRQHGPEAVAQQVRTLMTNLCKHIVTHDALVANQLQEPFDLVIGNPPYISFGARNQPAIGQSWSKYLKCIYPDSSEYKIRTHSLFQEIAIRMVPAGGAVVLLLPDAFLTGAFYKKLRTLINQQTNIVSLTELPESTFNDATAGQWCVAHYQRTTLDRQPDSSSLVELVQFDPRQGATLARFQLPQASLVTKDKSRFQLVFKQEDASLLSHLQDLSVVGSRYQGRTGIRARNGQSTIIAESSANQYWRKGIISGSNVTPHNIDWSGKFINTDSVNLFGGGHDHLVMERPKLLMRQTSDRPIGGIDRTGLYHLNNIHSFAPLDPNDAGALELLDALVNSTLWLYLYQLKSREKNRTLAQIDIEMIEAMPLPPPNDLLTGALIALVGALPDCAATETKKIQRAIDRLIYDIYALECKEVNHIENSIAGHERLQNKELPTSEQALELLNSFRIMMAKL